MTESNKHIVTNKACISLNNLVYNLEQIRNKVDPCELMAVVKADAYGHGLIQVADRLKQEGIKYWAVARLQEALELIDHGCDGRILIFGRLFQEELKKALQENIRITLTCPGDLELIAELARELGKDAYIHINVDSGMGRTGLFPEEAVTTILKAVNTDNIRVEGLYSHFSTADMGDKSYAMVQLERFKKLVKEVRDNDVEIPCIHMANGGAILDIPESYQGIFNMVRTGIILYGYYPSLETSESIPLKQVMTLKSRVLELRNVPANYPISYGCRYKSLEPITVAVLPIGYADGILRSFTNNTSVMIKGETYPIIGAVTMDQIMVAVDNQVEEGDEVIFWGSSGPNQLRASKVAAETGTISYELTCSVSTRVRKIYDEEC